MSTDHELQGQRQLKYRVTIERNKQHNLVSNILKCFEYVEGKLYIGITKNRAREWISHTVDMCYQNSLMNLLRLSVEQGGTKVR